MIHTADIVIIGGGVMGCSIAYHLAKQGFKNIILLEKDFLGSGSTGKSTAIVRTHYSHEVTARMALKSLRVFENFKEIVGESAGFVQTGFAVVVPERDLKGLQRNVQMHQKIGINTALLSADDLKRMEPRLFIEDLAAAAYEPESGYADPSATTFAFAYRARDMGAKIFQGAEVIDINVEHGKVVSVMTKEMEISTRLVVNAAGPWARRVGRMVGIDLPLEASRHQIATIRRSQEAEATHTIYGDFVHAIYLRPESGALSLLGSLGSREEEWVDPDQYRKDVDFSFVNEISERLCQRFPSMIGSLSQGGWAGLYTVTPDWHPILDQIPGIEGCYCAVGFSGHGFKLSPVIGEMMAELILKGKTSDPAIDITLFRAGRFAEKALIKGIYEYGVLA
ncbi:MAG: FAD-binding oxidoreductase [Candidatus Tectomicrobia bacterium]|nr:FAD-binding oxidoreductase [Candidatus Tectomicrobia bacterium]